LLPLVAPHPCSPCYIWKSYHVGGGCFVNGIMNGEALLGALNPGSRPAWKDLDGDIGPVTIDENGCPHNLTQGRGLCRLDGVCFTGQTRTILALAQDRRWRASGSVVLLIQRPRMESVRSEINLRELKKMGVNIQESFYLGSKINSPFSLPLRYILPSPSLSNFLASVTPPFPLESRPCSSFNLSFSSPPKSRLLPTLPLSRFGPHHISETTTPYQSRSHHEYEVP